MTQKSQNSERMLVLPEPMGLSLFLSGEKELAHRWGHCHTFTVFPDGLLGFWFSVSGNVQEWGFLSSEVLRRILIRSRANTVSAGRERVARGSPDLSAQSQNRESVS